jgi:hypothetical protein
MGGLALGAAATHRFVRDKSDMNILAGVQLLIALLAGLIAVALPRAAALDSPALLFMMISGLTFVAGLLNGADFPLATACCLAFTKGPEKATGTVYGVELFGACTGALLGKRGCGAGSRDCGLLSSRRHRERRGLSCSVAIKEVPMTMKQKQSRHPPSRRPQADGGLDRRDFLKAATTGISALCFTGFLSLARKAEAQTPRRGFISPTRSPWFSALPDAHIRCTLCPKQCRIRPGGRGQCRVRENREGARLHAGLWKPLPGSTGSGRKEALLPRAAGFSGPVGVDGRLPPGVQVLRGLGHGTGGAGRCSRLRSAAGKIVEYARAAGARSVSYAFGEPVAFYEYMAEVSALARQAGLLEPCSHQRVYLPGTAGGAFRPAGCRQHRPEELRPGLLPGTVRRRARARAGDLEADSRRHKSTSKSPTSSSPP